MTIEVIKSNVAIPIAIAILTDTNNNATRICCSLAIRANFRIVDANRGTCNTNMVA